MIVKHEPRNVKVRLLSSERFGWFYASKVYSGLGADTVI